MAQEETSLSDVVDMVRRRWLLIALVALSLLAGAAVYAERQPSEYDASAILAVTPRPAQPNADLVRVGAPRYASYITAAATLRQASAELGEDEGELRNKVTATITPDTGNITVTVRHTNPRRAVRTANALASRMQRASADDKLVRVELIAPAILPRSPSGPPRRLIEVAALGAGLLLGVALAALVDAVTGRPSRTRSPRNPSMSVAERPRRRLTMPPPASPDGPVLGGYPVVGELPWSKALHSSIDKAFADATVVEAAEGLYAKLGDHLGGDLRGIVVITSPGPHQGKTTIARLLATVLVRSNARVLLVDAHKEHTEIQRARNDRGNGTSGQPPEGMDLRSDTAMDWIRELWALDGGLWVLPAARGPVALALSEGQEQEIFPEARKMFDAIIVDGPPLLGQSGGAQASLLRTVIPLADGVLFVASPDSTVEALYQSIEALRTISAPFVGVVLNRIHQPNGITGPANAHFLPSRQPGENPDEQ